MVAVFVLWALMMIGLFLVLALIIGLFAYGVIQEHRQKKQQRQDKLSIVQKKPAIK